MQKRCIYNSIGYLVSSVMCFFLRSPRCDLSLLTFHLSMYVEVSCQLDLVLDIL